MLLGSYGEKTGGVINGLGSIDWVERSWLIGWAIPRRTFGHSYTLSFVNISFCFSSSTLFTNFGYHFHCIFWVFRGGRLPCIWIERGRMKIRLNCLIFITTEHSVVSKSSKLKPIHHCMIFNHRLFPFFSPKS